jgi:hypothetical protein
MRLSMYGCEIRNHFLIFEVHVLTLSLGFSDKKYGSILFCMGAQVRQLMRHCSLRSLVAKGTFSDADYFLRYGAKNNRHPLKVLLATSERSEQCRVS